MQRIRLLACDLDGTLIPLDLYADRQREIVEFNRGVRAITDLTLAYITGRHLQMALEGIAAWGLPMPDYLACDVGSSVYVRRQGIWVPDEDFRHKMSQAWRGRTAADICDILQGIDALERQEEEKQGEFKSSYYFPLEADRRRLLSRIEDRLRAGSLEASVIHSIDQRRGRGFLDLLPPGAGKDGALLFIRERLGLSAAEVVFAGDSGNDTRAFLSGVRTVVTGGAPAEVKQEVLRGAASRVLPAEWVFIAEEPDIRGVLEGCVYHGVFDKT